MGKKTNSDFVVRYTNKNIMDKLELVHEQVLKTNGRVTKHDSELKTIKTIVFSSIGIIVTTIIGLVLASI